MKKIVLFLAFLSLAWTSFAATHFESPSFWGRQCSRTETEINLAANTGIDVYRMGIDWGRIAYTDGLWPQ